MKRFTAMEIAALLLAALLFVGGASLVIWPPRSAGGAFHEFGQPNAGNSFVLMPLNPPRSRVAGVAGMALSAGLVWVVIKHRNT
jgi:hypothetical protein